MVDLSIDDELKNKVVEKTGVEILSREHSERNIENIENETEKNTKCELLMCVMCATCFIA